MRDDAFDLDAYLGRLGIAPPRAPVLATLQAVCAAQPAAIPFENVDVLLGRTPSLSVADLQAKLVAQRRGGYCFELNRLLAAALQALGMEVTCLAARVVWRQAPEAPLRPRTHMLLRVELPDAPGHPWVADAGFGGRLLGTPLQLPPDGAEAGAANGHERIVRDADAFTVETAFAGHPQPMVRFTLEPHQPVDYEPLNWFVATQPTSIFVNNLLAERLRPGLRATLFNDRLVLQRDGAPAEERRIDDAREFARMLDEVFDVEPPVPAAELFERVPRGLDGRAGLPPRAPR